MMEVGGLFNLYYSLRNKLIIFPNYLIHIINTDDLNNIDGNKISLQIENNSIICYGDKELNYALNVLDEYNIKYTIEDVIISDDIINKTKDVKYKNRIEAVNHIENNIEPESVKKARLEQENEDLKIKLQQTEDVLLVLMFGS